MHKIAALICRATGETYYGEVSLQMHREMLRKGLATGPAKFQFAVRAAMKGVVSAFAIFGTCVCAAYVAAWIVLHGSHGVAIGPRPVPVKAHTTEASKSERVYLRIGMIDSVANTIGPSLIKQLVERTSGLRDQDHRAIKRRTRPMLGFKSFSLCPDPSGRHRNVACDRQRTDDVRSRNPSICRLSILRSRNVSSASHIDLVRSLILTATNLPKCSSGPLRQIEARVGQCIEQVENLGRCDHFGVPGVHVAKTDRVTGQGPVEACIFGHGHRHAIVDRAIRVPAMVGYQHE
jgi:hypothetical protein